LLELREKFTPEGEGRVNFIHGPETHFSHS
jgi:hypothetical protein